MQRLDSVLRRGVASAQDTSTTMPLTVPAGVPLRLYLTKRVSKRLDAPVAAKLLTPLYAFDHEVIPAGTQVLGRVRTMCRARSISGAWEARSRRRSFDVPAPPRRCCRDRRAPVRARATDAGAPRRPRSSWLR